MDLSIVYSKRDLYTKSMDENIRIFLGLPVDPQDGDGLKAIFQSASIGVYEGLRWVDSRDYHVTIRFLGEFPKASIPLLIDALSKLSLPKPRLRALQISTFPKPGGHAIAAHLRLSSELAQLFHLISATLATFDLKFEHHAFRPHITIAKIKKNQKTSLSQEKLALKNYDIQVNELVLYQSLLDLVGSHYTPLHRFPLK